MLGYHRDPLERYVRHTWNTQSRWGIKRRNRMVLAALSVLAVATIAVIVWLSI